jgi:cyclophilin family peptidyl-prolyl cis-trans isomerase
MQIHSRPLRGPLWLTILLAICCAPPLASADDSVAAADVALARIDAFIATQQVDKTQPNWKLLVEPPPMAQFSLDKSYFWHLETNRGIFKIKLMPEFAPYHVTSTIYLTRLGFYDDVIFHRVITGFMAQGGDPTGTGNMGPGYRYAGEFHDDAKHNKRGIVSMANSGPGTDGSQFFITFAAQPSLNGKHTVFGELVEGKATLARFEKASSTKGKPRQKLYIKHATISVE